MDSVDDAKYFPDEPVYSTRVVPDEPLFIDMPQLKFLIAAEDVVVSQPRGANLSGVGNAGWHDDDRSVNIKWIQLTERDGVNSWQQPADGEFSDRIGAFRHLRCSPVPEIHGESPPFVGIRELWWPTLTAFREGVAADKAAFDSLLNRPAQAVNVLVHAERFK
jgi:hypothetical protein